MEFTYAGYFGLIDLLKSRGYRICGYHDWSGRCVVLRHDVDISLPHALRLGRLEAERGIRSTYFVLLRTDWYNPASAASGLLIRELRELGHEIGLHFDEAAYSARPLDRAGLEEAVVREADLLSSLCGCPIRAVSMHRPSPTTLEADYQIPGLVNSYGRTFFHDFKYLSDSRRHWREPVEDIIRGGTYERLHILTHPFWYQERERSMAETIGSFLEGAALTWYGQMDETVQDLESVLPRSCCEGGAQGRRGSFT